MSYKYTTFISREKAIRYIAKKKIENAIESILEEYKDYSNEELGNMLDDDDTFSNYIVLNTEEDVDEHNRMCHF